MFQMWRAASEAKSSSRARTDGKRRGENWCASSSPIDRTIMALPRVSEVVNGRNVHAVMDTGCTRSIVSRSLVVNVLGDCSVTTVDGRSVQCTGMSRVRVVVGGQTFWLSVIVAEDLLEDVEVILGMDVVARLGGVYVDRSGVVLGPRGGVVNYEGPVCSVTASDISKTAETKECVTDDLLIDDCDFVAIFDGDSWTVKWKWCNEAPVLRNFVGSYGSVRKPELKDKFEEEIRR